MKEMLVEQIGGLELVLAEAKFNLKGKIDKAFCETFELENIGHSKLEVYTERAEFKCDGKWGGDVNLYYYETYDETTPTLEMSIPSFRDTEFSRVITYGKIAEQAQLHGEEFIDKLKALKIEYKNGIQVVQNKLSEAEKWAYADDNYATLVEGLLVAEKNYSILKGKYANLQSWVDLYRSWLVTNRELSR